MPEGNVIHNQARRLSRAFRGKVVQVDSPQGRFSDGADRVDGHAVRKIEELAGKDKGLSEVIELLKRILNET